MIFDRKILIFIKNLLIIQIMIKYFKWSNLFSFKDETEISFEVNHNAPKTNTFLDYGGIRLSKINSVFGANASGKTNILNALLFIYNFIVHSFHFKYKGFLNYFPYMMNDESSDFEVSFFIDEVCYIYSFSVNKDCVLSEKLQKKDMKGTNLKTVFKRHGQTFENINFSNQSNGYKNIQNLSNHMVRPNASVISAFSQINQLEMQKISNFWKNNIIFPWYPNTQDMFGLADISKKYKQEPELLSELQNILNDLDIGEHKLSFANRLIVDSFNKNQSLLLPLMERYNSKEKKRHLMPLANESHGVFNLFSKMFFILRSIKKGGLVCIDELEAGIHPQAVSRILDLFKQDTNQKGQILFTTHMTPILTDLNKYQVYLVEKTKYNESEVFRLDQVKGVRQEDNLFKKYMAGVYGGFPDIDF